MRQMQQTQAWTLAVPACLKWTVSSGRSEATAKINSFRGHHHCESQQEWRKMMGVHVEDKGKHSWEILPDKSQDGWKGMDFLGLARVAWCLLRKECSSICTVTFYLKVTLFGKGKFKYLETLLNINILIKYANLIKSFRNRKKKFHFSTQKTSFRISVLMTYTWR